MAIINHDPGEVMSPPSSPAATPTPDAKPADPMDSYELFGMQDLDIDYYQVEFLLLRKVIITI